MKKLIKTSLFFCFIAFFISCDKIDNPIIKRASVIGTSFVTKNNFAVSDSKKTLIEDYTGMRCQNCPRAASTVANLVSQNPDKIIVIAVHAGIYAKPIGAWKDQDYRTNEGDIWDGSTGFSIPGYPNGMINRKDYASNGKIILDTKWSSVAELAKADPFVVKLNVTTNYDTIVGALNTDITAVFKTPYPNNIMISEVLIEDGIVGLQDISGVETEDYDFEHVLRGAVNGVWGTPLTSSASKVQDTVKVSFNNFGLKNLQYKIDNPDPAKIVLKPIVVNDKKVYVVVFAYDAITKEVLQVEKVKIR